MNALLERWRGTVERTRQDLSGLSDAQARRRPAPGSWSIKEIIGHLVDSAANNHRRFVEAQLQDSLAFPGYDGDAWVRLERYQDAPWPALVILWAAYNDHLIHVAGVIPEAEAARPRPAHTLDQIASRPVPRTEPATLGYLIEDYVGHLEHHLAQVRSLMPDVPGVVAFPPLIYVVPWAFGVGLHLLYPIHLLAPRLAHWAGGSITALAIGLAVWGRLAMSRAGTDPDPSRPATALVVNGPFRFTRNPLYISLTLFYLGLSLAVNALWPLVLLPGVLIVMQRGVVEREERYLERKFGEAYGTYRARVRRWL